MYGTTQTQAKQAPTQTQKQTHFVIYHYFSKMNVSHVITPTKELRQEVSSNHHVNDEIYEFCICSGIDAIMDQGRGSRVKDEQSLPTKVFRIKKYLRCGKRTTFAKSFKIYRAILSRDHDLSPLQGLLFQRRNKIGKNYPIDIKPEHTPDDIGMSKVPSPELIIATRLTEV